MLKKIFGFFFREVPWNKAALIFVPALVILSVTAVPILVPIDGVTYISGAKSILTPDFGTMYPLFREPLYPLFLKAMHYLGNAALLVVIVQSALVAIGGLMALYSVKRLGKSTKPRAVELLALLLLLANPIFLGYSAAFLQQSLFAFELAGFGLLLSWAILPPARIKPYVVALLTFLWYLGGIATSIGWVYLGLFPVAAVWSFTLLRPVVRPVRIRSRGWSRALKIVISVAISVGVVAVTVGIGTLTISGWNQFKEPYSTGSGRDDHVIQPITTVPKIPTLDVMTERVMALMDMTVIPPYERENAMFMDWQRNYSLAYDDVWAGKPYAAYARDYFAFSRPGRVIWHAYYAIQKTPAALSWYEIVFALMWASVIPLALLRRWRQLLFFALIPANFLCVYAASNSPIDRYGVPAYLMAAVFTVLLVGNLAELVVQAIRRLGDKPLGARRYRAKHFANSDLGA